VNIHKGEEWNIGGLPRNLLREVELPREIFAFMGGKRK
jgi:hypothetical protein